MADRRRDSSPLSNCRVPEHQELYLAVMEATKQRTSTRRQQVEQDADLRSFLQRHHQILDAFPND